MAEYLIGKYLYEPDYTLGSVNSTSMEMDCGNSAIYDVAGNDATISFWILNNDVSALRVPVNRGSYPTGGFYFQTYNNNFEVQHGAANVCRTDGGLIDTEGIWTFWVFKKVGGGKWHIYKNGAEISYLAQTTADPSSYAGNLYIGGYSGFYPYYIDGNFSKIKWFNRTLSDYEILQLYYDQINDDANLIGDWRCNDGAGTDAVDSSSSGQDGALTGTYAWSTSDPITTLTSLFIPYTTPISPPSNSDIVKKGILHPSNLVANFKLNNGTGLNDDINITKYIKKISDLKEKLTKSNVNVGGAVLPDLNIRLDNSRGKWNIGGAFFASGFIEKSIIDIELAQQNYAENGAFDNSFSDAFDVGSGYRDIAPKLKYRGIISTTNAEWDIKTRKLKLSLSSLSNLFVTEKVLPGVVSTDTFKNVIYKILNRSPFTRYMTIDLSNINPGYDLANVIDNPSELANKKVKNVLDIIAFLSSSVYYINYDYEFIFESIYDSSPTSIWTIGGADIISIDKLKFDWQGQYTSFIWDDDDNTVLRSEMGFADRESYQYRYREYKITSKYVLNETNRQLILDNLLLWNKHLKKKVTFTCKWNPDVLINKYINLDVPQEAIAADRFMVWNKSGHNWNAGLLWGIGSPGDSFDSSVFWRILEVNKDMAGEKLKIVARIAGIGPDDNL